MAIGESAACRYYHRSTNCLRNHGPLRSVDDPPVLVAHDPRGGLDLACGFDLSHDTGGLQMPKGPVTRGIQHRPREYRRDRRPEPIVVELLAGPLRRRGDALAPAMAVIGAGGAYLLHEVLPGTTPESAIEAE